MFNLNDDELTVAAFNKEALLSRVHVPEWMLDAMNSRKQDEKPEPRVRVTNLKQATVQA